MAFWAAGWLDGLRSKNRPEDTDRIQSLPRMPQSWSLKEQLPRWKARQPRWNSDTPTFVAARGVGAVLVTDAAALFDAAGAEAVGAAGVCKVRCRRRGVSMGHTRAFPAVAR